MDNSEARTRAVLLKAVSKMPRPLFIPTLNMMALDLLLVSLLFRTPFSVQQEMSQLLLRCARIRVIADSLTNSNALNLQFIFQFQKNNSPPFQKKKLLFFVTDILFL
ncbi:hypothetical protein T4C_3380 [Trichinella pseudospiralis]|uniref:Uncharacterized protein n=1 Tax=Trichinella pseudospiralis TaxID=6337 RepID=A0A0V1K2I6_TRIPS|nr:hypothetical protein T4C_3380 [Trichinella pseudospiralis]